MLLDIHIHIYVLLHAATAVDAAAATAVKATADEVRLTPPQRRTLYTYIYL